MTCPIILRVTRRGTNSNARVEAHISLRCFLLPRAKPSVDEYRELTNGRPALLYDGEGSVWSFSWRWRRFLGLPLLCHSPHIFISACTKWLRNSSKEFSFFLGGSSTLPVYSYKSTDKVQKKHQVLTHTVVHQKNGQKPFPKSCEINSGEFWPFTSKV